MKRLLITLIIPLISVIGASAKVKTPDFAYPKQVSARAETDLKKALDNKDGKATINALIRYGLARTSISNDNFAEVIAKTEAVIDNESSSVTRSLLNLLLADIYASFYSLDQSNLDQRTSVANPGDDITLWSGEQIKGKIRETIRQTFVQSDQLKSERLQNYTDIISADSQALICYPTLFEFACRDAISTLDRISETSPILPLSRLSSSTVQSLPSAMNPAEKMILEIADNWVEANPRPGAPRVTAILERFDHIENNLTDSESEEIDSTAFNALIGLYRQNSETPYSAEFIIAAADYADSMEEKQAVYGLLKDFSSKNPDYYRINAVRNMINRISSPSISINVPGQVAKGTEFDITVISNNVNNGKITIYRITDPTYSKSYYKVNGRIQLPVYKEMPVSADGTVPFSNISTVTATIDRYGQYVIIPSIPGVSPSGSYSVVRCSDIAVFDCRIPGQAWAWAVNAATGAPTDNVTIELKAGNRRGKPSKDKTLITDKNGRITIEDVTNSYELKARKGDDIYPPVLFQWRLDNDTTTRKAAFIRTALPVYHPGDTAEFMAVLYSYDKDNRHRPCSATKADVIVSDANSTAIDTLCLTSDRFGRISGSFTIPKDGLTGNFSLRIKSADNHYGSHWFMVSDYKLPTYEVSLDTIRPSTDGDGVIISGRAATYSGFPVADANVTLTLNGFANFWWRWRSTTFHTDSTRTDREGKFEFVAGKNILDCAPYPGGGISAVINVTSSSGENRTGSTSFNLGKKISISANLEPAIIPSADNNLNIIVEDMTGKALTRRVDITFAGISDTITVSAISENGLCRTDLRQIPSGSYDVIISTDGAAPFTDENLVIYRPDDTASPVNSFFWTPVNALSFDTTGCGSVLYATGSDDASILYTLSSSGRILEQRWLHPAKGMNKLEISLPHDVKEAQATLTYVRNMQFSSHNILITVPDPDSELKISIENFRDKVTPLEEETLTLHVSDGNGKPRSAAIILDIYAKSIDAIAPSSWKFTPSNRYMAPAYFSNSLPGDIFGSATKQFTNKSVISFESYPAFNLYNRSFGTYSMRKEMLLGYRANALVRNTSAITTDLYEEAAAVEAGVAIADDSGNALQDVVVTGYGIGKKEAMTGAASVVNAEQAYRPSEIPLALFRPELSTDSTGNASCSFTVPNANTTWILNALSFDDRLSTTIDVRQIVASKPVMVKPNLPRFLRAGDSAVIRASVMNNTDSIASINTIFEILNPADMSVIKTDTIRSLIDGQASAITSVAIVAPAATSAIMFRVKSSNGIYSDGEQTLIPILRDTQEVIDSDIFYLTPDQKEKTVTLPETAGNATTTISFCENPAWEVISALPGLSSKEAGSSFKAASDLFSASVASGIIKSDPSIESHLKEWLESNRDDATLLSMLEKNEDLKQFILASTPWVSDASSDNERMTRLALVFNSKQIKNAIEASVSTLEKFEGRTGGWRWNEYNDEPSLWATTHILNMLGQLKDLGYLNGGDRLDRMIDRALEYIDKETGDDFRKHPKSVYIPYTYVRSLFPETQQSTAAKAASESTVQYLLRNWKKQPTATKAISALILYRNKYANTARSLLQSLREFASSTPEQGMWWESLSKSSWWSLTANGQTAVILDAFNAIEPQAKEIDMIRQWLILNKQVQNWGNSVNASACIASILRSGSNWMTKPGDAVIAVNGTTLKPTDADILTGAITMGIDNHGGILTISRSASVPAWGSVMSRHTDVMSDIPESSVPELSVKKSVLVKRQDGWNVTDTLSVGDIAKIRLTVTVARDMDYITISDQRAACMEPVIQTPRPMFCDGAYFYLENRDAVTNLFIDRLPKGQYIIEYEMNANNAGSFSSGVATIQSQYTPEMTAHSSGSLLTVTE